MGETSKIITTAYFIFSLSN